MRMLGMTFVVAIALGASLGLTQAPDLAVNPLELKFTTAAGANPPSQRLLISKFGQGTLEWTAQARTGSGGDWLSVEPDSGTAPARVTVSVEASGLDPGHSAGGVRVSVRGSPGNSKVIPVSLTVTDP